MKQDSKDYKNIKPEIDVFKTWLIEVAKFLGK